MNFLNHPSPGSAPVPPKKTSRFVSVLVNIALTVSGLLLLGLLLLVGGSVLEMRQSTASRTPEAPAAGARVQAAQVAELPVAELVDRITRLEQQMAVLEVASGPLQDSYARLATEIKAHGEPHGRLATELRQIEGRLRVLELRLEEAGAAEAAR